jgi:hypothetical protein
MNVLASSNPKAIFRQNDARIISALHSRTLGRTLASQRLRRSGAKCQTLQIVENALQPSMLVIRWEALRELLISSLSLPSNPDKYLWVFILPLESLEISGAIRH